MKATVIGSGSIFFTRQLVKGMCETPSLSTWELALVDVHPEKCRQIGLFAERARQEYGVDLKISYTTDRLEALPGSDFVIFTFARDNMASRGAANQVAWTYGVRLYSGDTAGPGSVFRILRTVPEILEVAADIERICPQATVLNYVNPTNVIGAAIDRHTNLRWYSFCDGMMDDYWRPDICEYAGIEYSEENYGRLELLAGGINHCVWMWGMTLDGNDVWEAFKERLRRRVAQLPKDASYPDDRYRPELQLVDIFDAWPTLSCHALEYWRYFQGKGRDPKRDYVLEQWNLNARVRWTRRVWREVSACNDGKMSPKTDVLAALENDMLTRVLDSLAGNRQDTLPVNIRNDGRISNLPADAVVELFGRFSNGKVEVAPIGEMPRGPLGLTHATLDQQELALEASLSGEFRTVVRAIACDPTVMSLRDAENLAYDLMALFEGSQPRKWDSYWAEEDNSGRASW